MASKQDVLMPMTHLLETRSRWNAVPETRAGFQREWQQNLRYFPALVSNSGIRPQHYNLN